MKPVIYKWKDLDKATKTRLLRRSQANIDEVLDIVRPIIEDVRAHGDEALIRMAEKFEGAKLSSVKASEEEFAAAEDKLDDDLKAAIGHCVRNVRTFHQAQMDRVEEPWMVEVEPGVWAGEKITPIESTGLYVPRGKGAFPSAMYMLCIPAVLAGVSKIAVTAPPMPNGESDAAYLYTAKLCGVENVYKCGGAQAIAALAYGTETVPKVAKVSGPGSPYTQAARQLLFSELDPGMPASSSDGMVLADKSADPYNTVLDILNEAEHGKDSAVLFVTHDQELANYVAEHLPKEVANLPQPHREICEFVFGGEGYGGIVISQSLEHSIEIANLYAPEHLHLKVENPDDVMTQIEHAGEILIGEYTPSTLGNYGTGVNHVLPTGGKAKSYSCTSVWDFLKRISISRVDQDGFESLKKPILTLTEYEGFPAHGNVLSKRKV